MPSLTKRLLLLSLSHAILLTPKLQAATQSAIPTRLAVNDLQTAVAPKNQQLAIVFTPPAGWQMADAKELQAYPSVKAMVIGQSKTSFPPSLCLGMEAYQGNLKQYLKAAKATSDSQGSQWKDLGMLQTQAGEGHLHQEDLTTKWGEVREMHLILHKDGMIYMLTAAAAKGEFANFYRQFFDAMSSLRFSNN